MPHPLDGAKLKIIRAQEHLDSFKSEGRAFLDTRPYHFESEVYGERWWFKPRISKEPPWPLSAIVGDCLTNTRAALDYVLWELATQYFVPAIDVTNRDDRRITAFPIFEHSATEVGFSDRINRLSKRQVPAPALDAIKAAQPDASGDKALWWLHQFVNHDKHRMPILTISAFGEAQIVVEGYRNRNWLISSPIIKDGAAIKAEPELLASIRRGDVKVDIQASVYIACGDITMPREPLELTLEKIIKCAADIIPRFEPFF